MTMSYRMTPKGRSFMVLSNENSRQLLGSLGYPEGEQYRLKVRDLRRRIKQAGRVPREVRDYLTALSVATDHLLLNDTIYVN